MDLPGDVMSAKTQPISRPTPTVTAGRGTNGSPSPAEDRTVRSTRTPYVKVPMKSPSTTWLPRSELKFRSTRGEYWLLATWTATIVTEKRTPVTVIRLPVIVFSTLASTPAATVITAGRNQRLRRATYWPRTSGIDRSKFHDGRRVSGPNGCRGDAIRADWPGSTAAGAVGKSARIMRL